MTRKSKILATIGPGSRAPETVRALLEAGADGIRLNFSHGGTDEHGTAIERVRDAAADLGRPVAILADLAGPKIRTGDLRDGGPVELVEGREVCIVEEPVVGDAETFSSTHSGWIGDVPVGARVLIDDGALELEVVKREAGRLTCRVEMGGTLAERKGINLPGVSLSIPSMTEKDHADLAFALEQGVDAILLSFVRSANDIKRLQERIAAAGRDVPVIAKIEKTEAIDCLDEIVEAADGVLVARGDLGVEMSPERVPVLQKRIIARANAAGKPVITATEMLQSMMTSARPTRAEASDVANAVFDGSDALLLTGETAVGAHPALTVRTMDRIVRVAEGSPHALSRVEEAVARKAGSYRRAIAEATAFAAREMDTRLIVVFSASGRMARQMAALRPRQRIIALTPSESNRRRLAFVWGVEPWRLDFGNTTEGIIRAADELLLREGIASPGEEVVMMAGKIEDLGISRAMKIRGVGR